MKGTCLRSLSVHTNGAGLFHRVSVVAHLAPLLNKFLRTWSASSLHESIPTRCLVCHPSKILTFPSLWYSLLDLR